MLNIQKLLEEGLSRLDEREFERMYSLLHAIGGTKEQLDVLEQERVRRECGNAGCKIVSLYN